MLHSETGHELCDARVASLLLDKSLNKLSREGATEKSVEGPLGVDITYLADIPRELYENPIEHLKGLLAERDSWEDSYFQNSARVTQLAIDLDLEKKNLEKCYTELQISRQSNELLKKEKADILSKAGNMHLTNQMDSMKLEYYRVALETEQKKSKFDRVITLFWSGCLVGLLAYLWGGG